MKTLFRLKRFLLGQSLETEAEHQERLTVPAGLAIFASDALSSSAYASEEILITLTAAAPIIPVMMSNLLTIPISMAIVLLLTIVVLSYRELIRVYPSGGGAYVVAKENLGIHASLVAGAALLVDYILTVSVSISAGVAAITSAFPALFPHRVFLGVLLIGLMTLANLRGLRESARMFAFPTYLFIAGMSGMIIWGMLKQALGIHDSVIPAVAVAPEPLPLDALAQLSLTFVTARVLLHGFASGCTALTGIEAISNGVSAFKEPSARRANTTMALLGFILAFLFFGISYLAYLYHVQPVHDETVISQIAKHVFDGVTPMYYVIQIVTMVILVMAANTSFNGFPRLASFLAQDSWVPRQFGIRGDKLVFSNGIAFLGIVSAMLVIIYHGSTHALIPLYAVGVFISFTLAQSGLFKRHLATRGQGWVWQAFINGLGGLITGIVMLVIASAKFMDGAWMVVFAIPGMIWIFKVINRHYKSVQRQLAVPDTITMPAYSKSIAVILISGLHQGTVRALSYGKLIAEEVIPLHISINAHNTDYLKTHWERLNLPFPLTIVESPYRQLTQPLLEFIDKLEAEDQNDLITIIIPEFVTKKWWHNMLHNQSALTIRLLLRWNRRAVVTSVRFYLEE